MNNRAKVGQCNMFQFEEAFKDAARTPFPMDKVVPKQIRDQLEPVCVYFTTTLEMLLAALLPAVSCCMGPNARIRNR